MVTISSDMHISRRHIGRFLRLSPLCALTVAACGTEPAKTPDSLAAADSRDSFAAAKAALAAQPGPPVRTFVARDASPPNLSATPSDLLPADVSGVGSDLNPKNSPAENFNLKPWKLTLPEADTRSGKKNKVLEVQETQVNTPGFIYKPWFFTSPSNGGLVFKTPNHAPTTKGSSNTRSELREMIRAGNKKIKTHSPKNNFVLAAHPKAKKFASIGGKLASTLKVDWVSTSGNDAKYAAHSVVVGQIHGSGKMEPVKIFYRKLPGHDKGSLFWNYELSPENQDDRQDVPHNVWGDYNLRASDPSPADGIALEERFSYVIDVTGDILTVSFKKSDGTVVAHSRDIAAPYTGYELDLGYGRDWMYFKAGAYNQCNLGTKGNWGTACSNDGIEAGDYAQVTFFQIDVSH